MGNVIPWSQIHPGVKTEEPFVAVVVVDPHRRLCISEIVEFDEEALADPDLSAPTLVAAAQGAAARVAAGYRSRRRQPEPEAAATRRRRITIERGGLRLLQGGLSER